MNEDIKVGDRVRYAHEDESAEGVVVSLFVEMGVEAVRIRLDDGLELVTTRSSVTHIWTAGALAARDHADLIEAAGLIKGVMERHNGSLTGPALVALTQAITDMRIGERYLGATEMADKQQQNRQRPTAGEIADRIDDRANGRIAGGAWQQRTDPLAEVIADRIVGNSR